MKATEVARRLTGISGPMLGSLTPSREWECPRRRARTS
jgi:hypothetical protein